MWHVIHATSFTYPTNPSPTDKAQYKQFLDSLADVMCCKECQKHFRQYLANTPPDLESSHTLTRWAVDFHNSVNARLGKHQPSYVTVANMYVSEARARDLAGNADTASIGYAILGAVGILALVVVVVVMLSRSKTRR
jgi:hypothetical protein